MAKKEKYRDRNIQTIKVEHLTNPYTEDFLFSIFKELNLSGDIKAVKKYFDQVWDDYQVRKQFDPVINIRSSETRSLFEGIKETSETLSNLLNKMSLSEEDILGLISDESGFIGKNKEYGIEDFKDYNNLLIELIEAALSELEEDKGGRKANLPETALVLNLLEIVDIFGLSNKGIQAKFIHECLKPIPAYRPKIDKYDLEHENNTLKKWLHVARQKKKEGY